MPITAFIEGATVAGTNWTADAGSLQSCVATVDDVRANHTGPVTDWLISRNFDFAGEGIVSTDVIEGIELDIGCKSGTPFIDAPTLQAKLTLNGTDLVGTAQETAYGAPGSILSRFTLGSPTNTWGLNLTGADVLAATFGVGTKHADTNPDATQAMKVDVMYLKIYYAAGTVTGPISSAIEDIDYIPGIGISRPTDMTRRS